MKNVNLFNRGIVAALFATTFGFGIVAAQDSDRLPVLELGIRYMPTFSSIDVRTYNGNVIEGSVKVRHGFGGVLAINFGTHVGIQGEVNYYQVSQDYKDFDLNRTVKVRYLNVPVLLSLNSNKAGIVNLNLVAGPQFGFNVGSSFKSSGAGATETLNAKVALKKGDVGFAYGAGLGILLNGEGTMRLDMGYRGFYGLVKINDDAGANSYNVLVNAYRQSHGAYIGLSFLF